jgi:hypothetical protein
MRQAFRVAEEIQIDNENLGGFRYLQTSSETERRKILSGTENPKLESLNSTRLFYLAQPHHTERDTLRLGDDLNTGLHSLTNLW